jgi:(p)ppGpp synthase/HD superfamily hydrolase
MAATKIRQSPRFCNDAAEDQGGQGTLDEIRRRFGDLVADIVYDCTDAWVEPKPAWRPRKEAYLKMLPKKSPRSLLVSLADKVHNAEAILFDYRVLGEDLWRRFNGGAEGTRWYYKALAGVFSQAMAGAVLDFSS